MIRSHYCADISKIIESKEVSVAGWVVKKRNLGGLIFLDIRDITGVIQAVVNPEFKDVFEIADKIKQESCIKVTGNVSLKPSDQIKENDQKGDFELQISGIDVLNMAEPLPINMDIAPEKNSEEQRLKYRYLDLRNISVAQKIIFRSQMNMLISDFMKKNHFFNIETPMLTKSTPEGARDYIVPSRTNKNCFFALPQSPQLFKQLLMVSGFDRYYQIVRCFRDEDLRLDRQPEFTQLDVEMSFVDAVDVMKMSENLVKFLFKTMLKVDLPEFPVVSYEAVMDRYGSDKPDLRNPLFLVNLKDMFLDSKFNVFNLAANNKNSKVVAMKIPEGAEFSRKKIDDYAEFVKKYGAKGLAWMKINGVGEKNDIQSPISKFLDKEEVAKIIDMTEAQSGDLVFFVADNIKIVDASLGALRDKVAADLDLIDCERWAPLWVVDFPMFEKTDDRLHSLHHPFTAPKDGVFKEDVETTIADAYDLVLNGFEIGGGSKRINNAEMQLEVFKALGFSQEQAESEFGFFVNSLKYGAPPHAGIAFGLDRIAMLMTNASSIRDVIAFPKTTKAACPLTLAPNVVAGDQLNDLGLEIKKEDK